MRFIPLVLITATITASSVVRADDVKELPLIEFPNGVTLLQNPDPVEKSKPSIFTSKSGKEECQITYLTPAFRSPKIIPGRQLALKMSDPQPQYSDMPVYDLLDPNKEGDQKVGTLVCFFSSPQTFTTAIHDTLGADPVGGLREIDIKYRPSAYASGVPQSTLNPERATLPKPAVFDEPEAAKMQNATLGTDI